MAGNPYTARRDAALALIATGTAAMRGPSAWSLGQPHLDIATGLQMLAGMADGGEDMHDALGDIVADAKAGIVARSEFADPDAAAWTLADVRHDERRAA